MNPPKGRHAVIIKIHEPELVVFGSDACNAVDVPNRVEKNV
jgi:hypothetical protein